MDRLLKTQIAWASILLMPFVLVFLFYGWNDLTWRRTDATVIKSVEMCDTYRIAESGGESFRFNGPSIECSNDQYIKSLLRERYYNHLSPHWVADIKYWDQDGRFHQGTLQLEEKWLPLSASPRQNLKERKFGKFFTGNPNYGNGIVKIDDTVPVAHSRFQPENFDHAASITSGGSVSAIILVTGLVLVVLVFAFGILPETEEDASDRRRLFYSNQRADGTYVDPPDNIQF
jgi:hypothetical protein